MKYPMIVNQFDATNECEDVTRQIVQFEIAEGIFADVMTVWKELDEPAAMQYVMDQVNGTTAYHNDGTSAGNIKDYGISDSALTGLVSCTYEKLKTPKIDRELIEKGIERKIIRIDLEDDLLAAYIGGYWFYISSEYGLKPEQFSIKELSKMVDEAINSEPIYDEDEDQAAEFLYYRAILLGSLNRSNSGMEKTEG